MASVRNSTAAKWLVLTALMGVGVLGTSLAYAAGTNQAQGPNGDVDDGAAGQAVSPSSSSLTSWTSPLTPSAF